MTMSVALFDIDGTLIDAGGAGRAAIARAADKLYGRLDLFDGIRFDGCTDRGICREALRHYLPHRCNEEEISRLIEAYVELLPAEIASAPRFQVFPGVELLLSSISAAGVLAGLGTGNVEKGARIKLERASLNPRFTFGGFGDDAEERGAILRCGLQRAERILGRPAREVWVIGDTPRDLAAGRAIGAKVALVATGHYGLDSLLPLGADLCVASLDDPRLRGAIAGGREPVSS
jgi:phosphoglycolate phosphatase-like HAD superfamily hydrolase